MFCAIWYHYYNLKNAKNTHGGVFLLVILRAQICHITKSSTPPWVFFTYFKLYKWYQIAQSVSFTVHFEHMACKFFWQLSHKVQFSPTV